MIDKTTYDTVHILNYPDLTVKKFQNHFYDGEAALALLRLFQIDNNKEWLETCKILWIDLLKKIIGIS